MPKAAHVCAASLATSVGQTSSAALQTAALTLRGKEWDYVRPAGKSQGLRGTKWLVCGIQYLWHRSPVECKHRKDLGALPPEGWLVVPPGVLALGRGKGDPPCDPGLGHSVIAHLVL